MQKISASLDEMDDEELVSLYEALEDEPLEKEAYTGIAAKPFHELSDAEVKKLKENIKGERKTPESIAAKGLGVGAGGAFGALTGVGAGAARASDRGLASTAERQLMRRGGLKGGLVGAGATAGLIGLGQLLADRRIEREESRRKPKSRKKTKTSGLRKEALGPLGALLGLPLAGAASGAAMYGLGGIRRNIMPMSERLAVGAASGGALGAGLAGLIGIGKLLEKADPSGNTLNAAVQLAPAAMALSGARSDMRSLQAPKYASAGPLAYLDHLEQEKTAGGGKAVGELLRKAKRKVREAAGHVERKLRSDTPASSGPSTPGSLRLAKRLGFFHKGRPRSSPPSKYRPRNRYEEARARDWGYKTPGRTTRTSRLPTRQRAARKSALGKIKRPVSKYRGVGTTPGSSGYGFWTDRTSRLERDYPALADIRKHRAKKRTRRSSEVRGSSVKPFMTKDTERFRKRQLTTRTSQLANWKKDFIESEGVRPGHRGASLSSSAPVPKKKSVKKSVPKEYSTPDNPMEWGGREDWAKAKW